MNKTRFYYFANEWQATQFRAFDDLLLRLAPQR